MIYRFALKSSIDVDEAWETLANAGVEVLYSEEEDDHTFIYGLVATSLPELEIFDYSQATDLPDINWQDQWSIHGHDYHDGYVHLNLQDVGFQGELANQWNPLRLIPGPGFGDLSHPSTKLVLKLMAYEPLKEPVLDVGCGSGILAISAIAMGAPKTDAIDIDPLALEHTYKNVSLNEMDPYINISTPSDYHPDHVPPFILMNMISSEQVIAWNSLAHFHSHFKKMITSGIHKDEIKSYLTLTKSWGWVYQDQLELDDWIGFIFSK